MGKEKRMSKPVERDSTVTGLKVESKPHVSRVDVLTDNNGPEFQRGKLMPEQQIAKGIKAEVKRDVSRVVSTVDHSPTRPSFQVALSNLGSKFAEYVTMPGEFSADQIPRYNPPMSSRNTAVCNPKERIAADFVIGDSTVPTECVGFKFRDPYRSFVHSVKITSGYSYARTLRASVKAGNNYIPCATLVAQGSLNERPHGPLMYPGRSQTDLYFWYVQAGHQITIAIPFAVPSNFTHMTLIRYEEGADLDYVNVATNPTFGNTSTSWSPSIALSGYYSFCWSQSTAINETRTFTLTVGTSLTDTFCWGHRSTPDLDQNFRAATDIRHVAGSLMFTNVTSNLNLQGYFAAKQYPEDTDWMDIAGTASTFGSSVVDTIGSANDAFQDDVKQGAYGFLKPANLSDLDLFNSTVKVNYDGLLADVACYFNLKNDAEWMAIGIRVTSPEGQSAYWTLVDGLEYITVDKWRPLANSTLTPKQCSDALSVVCRVQQFHCNKTHIKEIWSNIKNLIGKAAKMVLDYGPYIIKGAKLAAPLLAM